MNWCKQPDVGLLTPDLVLFLDLPIEAAEQRGGFGEERYEKREMQIKVRELFLQLQDPLWQVRLLIVSWCILKQAINSVLYLTVD